MELCGVTVWSGVRIILDLICSGNVHEVPQQTENTVLELDKQTSCITNDS